MRARLGRTVGVIVLAVVVVLTGCTDATTSGSGTPAAAADPNTSATTSSATTVASRAATTLSGCNQQAAYSVCFNSPGTHGGSDAAVINQMTAIFQSAGAGDSLRIAMFRWDTPAPAAALIASQQRGAHVEIVADHDMLTNAIGRHLIQTIEAGEPGRNVTVCRGACLPWRGRGPAPPSQNVVHLKLILADIGGVRSVVTSSNNLEQRQVVQYNSLLKVDDPSLYAWQLQYWKRLRHQRLAVGGDRWGDAQKAYAGPPAAMVYPRRGDVLEQTLQGVTCAPGMNQVDIMVAVIQRYDVRNQIGRLFLDGCHLRIVTTRDLIENWLQKPFQLPDGRTVDLPDRRVRTIVTHDKVYAIHARFHGQESHLVVTGTSNTTCGGLLYNDEIMLRLSGTWLFDQYDAHVLDAYRHAHQARVGAVPVQRHCS